MFDRFTQWSLDNKFLVLIAYGVLLLFGGLVLHEISLDVFPEFAPPQVVIQTQAPGFSPEDVEALVTFPIESTVNGTPGVVNVRSSSTVGLSTVTVIFKSGVDIYQARQLVNERLALARERFPSGAQAPVMLPVTSAVSWLVKYALYADGPKPASAFDLRTYADWEINNRLLAIQGVASVVSMGGDVKQYQVLLSPRKLQARRVTAAEVIDAVKGANLNAPGGFLEPSSDQEYILTGQGRITSLDDLRNSVVKVSSGVAIPLSQVADVRFGAEVKRGDASYRGIPAVIGTVSKLYGADTIKTTRQVDQVLKEIQARLPSGMKMNIGVFRQADFIDSAVANLREALLEGAVVVTLVLVLFLLNARAALISFLAMPISLIAGIIAFKSLGIGINSMTLAGLVISLGVVVDDAIIYVENIIRRLRENRRKPNPDPVGLVVFHASKEIRDSVVFATLIIIVVFLPIFFLPGLAGRIFAPLGIAYIFTVAASLIVAVTLTPVLCRLLLVKRRDSSHDDQESRTVRRLKDRYARILTWSLGHPRRVTAIAGVLLAGTLATLPFFGKEFLPEFREGNYIIAVSTLPGTSLAESMRLGERIQKTLMKYPEVVSIDQRAGRAELDEDAQPVNFSEFDVTIRYGKKDPDALLRAIRADLAQFPGIALNIGQFIAHRMDEVTSGIRAQIAIKIYGPDLEVLREKGREVHEIMASVKGVTDLQLEPQIAVPGVVIAFDRAAAARYGLSVEAIGRFVETAFNGITVSQVLEGQKTFDLFVRFDDASRKDLDAVGRTLIDTPTGAKIPLNQVAKIRVEDRPYVINRENVMRRIVVQSNVAGRDLNGVVREAQEKIAKQVKLPPDYFIEFGGQFKSQQEAQTILTTLGTIAILIIFTLLYKALGSAKAAAIVMANLPLALIGGVIAVFFTGGILSVASMIGFITLFGIATRNGVILVTHYEHLIKEEGKTFDEALFQGSLDRLVPVLMTASTAALGLLPTLWGSPTGKELVQPVSWVLLGGLVTSTLLNMVLVPVLFKRFGKEATVGGGAGRDGVTLEQ